MQSRERGTDLGSRWDVHPAARVPRDRFAGRDVDAVDDEGGRGVVADEDLDRRGQRGLGHAGGDIGDQTLNQWAIWNMKNAYAA